MFYFYVYNVIKLTCKRPSSFTLYVADLKALGKSKYADDTSLLVPDGMVEYRKTPQDTARRHKTPQDTTRHHKTPQDAWKCVVR